ncbi:MAG: hypothetical protein ACMUIP_14445 [bacterium]
MSKVIEKKNFFILFIALCMVMIPFIAEAGGGGMKSSMGGMSKHTNYTTYTYTNRANSYVPNYSGYYYGTPSYSYSVPRYNTVLSPSITASPYTWGSLGGGLNAYSYGSSVIPVTSKDYTVEKSYTQYLPTGAVTTTYAETTDTDYISVGSPYANTYGWGGLLGNTYNYNYGLNSYGLGAASPYSYNYGYSWPYF